MPDTLFKAHYTELADPEKLHGTFGDMSAKLTTQLSRLEGRDRAKAWLLRLVAQEFLKYVIEDDCVDDSEFRKDAAKYVRQLVADDAWLTPPLLNAIDICCKVAKKEPLHVREALLTFKDQRTQARAWLASSTSDSIPLSSTARPLVPVLERSLGDPKLGAKLISAFVSKILELKQTYNLTALCFVQKEVGPVGAITLLGSLVPAADLPATIFRENYWIERSRFAAYQPKPEDRIAIVYDLNVTGHGIRHVATQLGEQFHCDVVAAVVLFGYDKTGRITTDGHAVEVYPLDRYDNFVTQVESIQETAVQQTLNIQVLPLEAEAHASSGDPNLARATPFESSERHVDMQKIEPGNPGIDRDQQAKRKLFPYWMFAVYLLGGVTIALSVIGAFFRPLPAGITGVLGCLLLFVGSKKAEHDYRRLKGMERFDHGGEVQQGKAR